MLVVAAVVPVRAHAANDACFAASTQGQKLALDKRWRAAREKFAACAASSCPTEVADDCKARLAMSEASIGSIVVTVVDAAGGKSTEGRVVVDGETAATSLDGKPIEVDPGTHAVRVESSAASAPFTRDVVVAEGAKSVAVLFTVPSPEAAPSPSASSNTSSDASASSTKTPVSVWVLGGVGVVGLACFAGFGIAALSQSSDLHARAPGTYTTDDVDSLKRKRLLADVSLGVGLVALGVAAVIYTTRPSEPTKDVAMDMRAVPGGAVATWGGSF